MNTFDFRKTKRSSSVSGTFAWHTSGQHGFRLVPRSVPWVLMAMLLFVCLSLDVHVQKEQDIQAALLHHGTENLAGWSIVQETKRSQPGILPDAASIIYTSMDTPETDTIVYAVTDVDVLEDTLSSAVSDPRHILQNDAQEPAELQAQRVCDGKLSDALLELALLDSLQLSHMNMEENEQGDRSANFEGTEVQCGWILPSFPAQSGLRFYPSSERNGADPPAEASDGVWL